MARICKILVVEGHDAVRDLLGDALGAAGYSFTLVETGAAMRRALDGAPYDIAVIDVSMRDEDGFALAEEAARRGLAVILTTADRDKFGTVERSGLPHVLKPYQMSHLLDLIWEVRNAAELRCIRRNRAVR